jgi:lipopolysaccharide heptosyltransferase I
MGQVVTDSELLTLVAADRHAGRTIAFANGCFDVLHVGHVRYLEGAAQQGDRLIVAINDDASEAALKGPGRPILDAAARAELVAALRVVHYVVVFSERSVERLLNLIKPDVHCKGTDYTVDTVPERETVKAYGGRIAIVGDPKDHSTKELLEQLREKRGRDSFPDDSHGNESRPRFSRILIVRLGSLGDLVHTLPAVAAIRRTYPAAEIDWLVDAAHRSFLELVPAVSSLVVLRDRSARAWLEARRMMRARHYDVALDFQGLLKSAALARLSGASRVVGFDRAGLREPLAAPFYGERVTVDDSQHVIRKNLELAAAIGVRPGSDRGQTPMDFPIAPVDSPVVASFLATVSAPFAVMNPGAAWPNKRWPPDKLGAVARDLRSRHGMASVVLWGPGEQDAASAVVASAGGAAHLAPETGLRELIALLRPASLMVSGDTGPLHIAGALGVPIVALFGPTTPGRNGPWSADDVSISRYEACDCHYERRCRRDAGQWCLGTIAVDEVTRAIDQRLARAHSRDRRP